jgi:hypothetical protein
MAQLVAVLEDGLVDVYSTTRGLLGHHVRAVNRSGRSSEQEEDMAKVVVQHHVADFDAWYPVFTEHESVRTGHGGTGHSLMRAADDANNVVIVLEFASADGARAFMADPSLPEAMARAGVDSEPAVRLCEEVESKTYG